MSTATLLAFALAFFVFAASPGPDNLTIVARTVSHGARAGLAYGAGTAVGILVFLSLAAFGLSVMAARIGVRLWTAPPVVPDTATTGRGRGAAGAFLTGISLNLGNPKMPLFYVALLPNVVGTSLTVGQVGELAAIILSVELVVVGGHVILATRARRYLRTPRLVRRASRGAGGLMIGAGVAVAASR